MKYYVLSFKDESELDLTVSEADGVKRVLLDGMSFVGIRGNVYAVNKIDKLIQKERDEYYVSRIGKNIQETDTRD